MSRILPASLSVAMACLWVPAARCGEESREVTVIASAFDSPRESEIGPVRMVETGGVVIRNLQDLVTMSAYAESAKSSGVRKELEVELARALGVDSIDWTKQMVLALRGESGTRLDRIHVESLKAEGKVLTISWKVKQRPPHAGPGSPVALLLVDRFEEVKFVEVGRK